jgi:hypothetical protein
MSSRYFLALGLVFLGCGDDAPGASQAVANRLDQCGLLRAGELNLDRGEIPACISSCRVNASCKELEELYCELEASEKLLECEAACFVSTPCASGRGGFTALQRCDGERACDDGTDEENCSDVESPPRYCLSSGERIWALQVCNGKVDCEDGTDEDDCLAKEELFLCRRIPQRVPKRRVCDLQPDCLDGSDESVAEGCAQLICH